MAWGRVVRVVVRSPALKTGDKWEWTEVDIASLDLDFEIIRSRIFNDNEATVTIYNASEDTQNKVLTRGSNILIYAGYSDEGEAGLIYQGNIIDSQTTSVDQDTVTTLRSISLRSLERPFTSTPVVLHFQKNSNWGKVVEAISGILGLIPIGLENIENITLPGGWTFIGSSGEAIERVGRDLRAHNCGLYIDVAQLVIYSLVADSSYSVAYLRNDCGLLDLADTTDYLAATRTKVSELAGSVKQKSTVSGKSNATMILRTGAEEGIYKALDEAYTSIPKTYDAHIIMMPKIKPNNLVHLCHGKVDGLFVVDRMIINGGNRSDSEFSTHLDLVEA